MINSIKSHKGRNFEDLDTFDEVGTDLETPSVFSRKITLMFGTPSTIDLDKLHQSSIYFFLHVTSDKLCILK
jgi:hypothetical protein